MQNETAHGPPFSSLIFARNVHAGYRTLRTTISTILFTFGFMPEFGSTG